MSRYPLIVGAASRASSTGSRAGTAARARRGARELRPAMLAPDRRGLTDPVSGLIMGRRRRSSRASTGSRAGGGPVRAREPPPREGRAGLRQARGEVTVRPSAPAARQVAEVARARRLDPASRRSGAREAETVFRSGRVTVGPADHGRCGAILVEESARPRSRADGAPRSFAWTGCDPARMGLGPDPRGRSTRRACARGHGDDRDQRGLRGAGPRVEGVREHEFAQSTPAREPLGELDFNARTERRRDLGPRRRAGSRLL